MLLYAGTTSILEFNYYTVKMLKLWRESAGNFVFQNNRTSETIRNNTAKWISIHVPKNIKPISDNEFGDYLAGLIDSKGNFNKQQELILVFHKNEASLAYYLKKRIGYGSVKKIQNKDIIIFMILKKEGLKKTINLINNKIRTKSRFNEIILNIMSKDNYYNDINLERKSEDNLNNYWLAGFSDLSGNFKENVSEKPKLYFQINSVEKDLLLLIKKFLSGSINYNESKNIYTYFSEDLKNIINYFDTYKLFSTNYLNFLKWRKIYLRLYKIKS